MSGYRIYSLNGNGSIGLAEEIVANSDEEAVAKAHDMKRHTRKCEVWAGRRLIATLDAHDLAD